MLKFRIFPLFVSASWILLSGFEFGDLLKGARDQVIKHTDKGISVERVLKSINDKRSEFQNMENLEKCAWSNYEQFGQVLLGLSEVEPEQLPVEIHWHIFSTQVAALGQFHSQSDEFFVRVKLAKDSGVQLFRDPLDVQLADEYSRFEAITDEVIRSAVARHDRIIEASHRAGDRKSDLRLFNSLRQCKSSYGY